MRKLGTVLIASATTLIAGSALAADMGLRMPLPQVPVAMPVDDMSGWYLRGDIGMTNHSAKSRYNDTRWDATYANPAFGIGHDGFGSGLFYGLGVGYQFNSWLRFDVTGEYRGKARFNKTEYLRLTPPSGLTDTYSADLSSWVGLVNAYADLGTWWCITPFVGVGVGYAYNTISGWQDVTAGSTTTTWWADSKSTGSFAWAVHAGLSYKVTPGLTIELGYRYLDLGKASTGGSWTWNPAQTVFGGPQPGLGYGWNHLVSHDVKLGMRWSCCDAPPPPPPPIVRKG